MQSSQDAKEPAREDIDALNGSALIEFGASWCGHCMAAKPLIAEALGKYPDVRFVWVEDGKGKALGRSYHVKLWPTLIFLKDGRETERLVRPSDTESIERALAKTVAL